MRFLYIPAIIIMFFFCGRAGARDLLDVVVSDNYITIDRDFRGSLLMIFGTTQLKDYDVIIAIDGGDEIKKVLQKEINPYGLWIVKNIITFKNIPSFYFVDSTKLLLEILNRTTQYYAKLGEANVRFGIFSGNYSSDGYLYDARQMIISGMANRKTLSVDCCNSIQKQGGMFMEKINLPSTMPDGKFAISVYITYQKNIVSIYVTPLIVEKIGFNSFMSDIAMHHKPLYLAINLLVAIIIGLTADAFWLNWERKKSKK